MCVLTIQKPEPIHEKNMSDIDICSNLHLHFIQWGQMTVMCVTGRLVTLQSWQRQLLLRRVLLQLFLWTARATGTFLTASTHCTLNDSYISDKDHLWLVLQLHPHRAFLERWWWRWRLWKSSKFIQKPQPLEKLKRLMCEWGYPLYGCQNGCVRCNETQLVPQYSLHPIYTWSHQ